jgi:3-methyladenine DNA glycosylase AlkD
MQYRQVMRELRARANPDNVAGMARFGINPHRTLGISMVELRKLARRVGKNHALAQQLWASGLHEARILACLVDEPAQVDEAQLESWVKDFDSWDVCDQCCGSLFDKTPYAYRKAMQWSKREEEFVKRAGFVLMASLAVHDKRAPDAAFEKFLPALVRAADDPRNFVKKAVNWALRQIGKRNRELNVRAIETARQIQALESSTARWIAADALRELTSAAVQKKLQRQGNGT